MVETRFDILRYITIIVKIMFFWYVLVKNYMGGFQKRGYPKIAGWFTMENPHRKLDDFGGNPNDETESQNTCRWVLGAGSWTSIVTGGWMMVDGAMGP